MSIFSWDLTKQLLLSFTEHYWLLPPAAVPVWLEYAKFAVERMSVMPEGMEFPRDVFERGIIACGLHVSQVNVCVSVQGEGGGGGKKNQGGGSLQIHFPRAPLLLTPLLISPPPCSLSFSLPTSLFSSSYICLPSLQAGALWDTYRQFEQAVLSSMQVHSLVLGSTLTYLSFLTIYGLSFQYFI